MDTPLKKDGSKSQDLTENTKMDGQPQDSNAEAEENKSNHPNEKDKDDSKSPSKQVEEDKSKDLKEQNEDDTKQFLKTSELQEDTETSTLHSSSSWGRETSDWKDVLSTFLTPEQSTTNFSSLISEHTDTDDLKTATWVESQLVNPELQSETVPVCIWKKQPTAWKEEERRFSIPARKPSFHNRCGCSTTERLIKHSPLHLSKAPFHKNIMWKHQRPLFRGHEICTPEKGLFKAVKRKKDHRAFAKPQMLRMLSSKGSNRQSKAMYNLYTTFCDEGKYFDPCLLHGAKGLSRACTIFSAIRRGRVHINYLLLTLHTLGILMTKAQMFQVLQFIPIDAYGNLDFYDFLDVARNTLLYIDLEAFENVQGIFRTIKKDMIAIEELEPTLTCLGVSLNPLIIEQTLEHTTITKDGKLNISEFLSAVKGLLSQHLNEYGILERGSCQDFPTMDDSEVERRRNILLDKGIPLGYAHLIGLYEPGEELTIDSLEKKANKFQKPVGLKQTGKATDAVSVDEKDKKEQSTEWPKVRSKYGYTSHDTLFPLSSTLPLGESKMITSQTKLRLPLKKPPILPDLSLVPHASLSSESMKQKKKKKKKKLSFQEDLPTRHDLDEDKQETDAMKAESEDTELSEDLSFQEALQNIFDDIQMLMEDSIKSHDLYSALNKLGITISDAEFQKMLQNVDVAKDGTVNFNSFISIMEKMYFLSEFAILKHTIQAIDKIEEDKMVLHDLPSFIRNMGIQLHENELEETLKQVAIDGNGKIIVKDFIEILTRSPQFKELTVMKDTIQAVNNIKENKVSLKDLKTTLQKMGIHLYPQEYEDLIQMIPADREGKVDTGQVIEKIFKLQRFSDIEVLNYTIEIINQFKETELNVSEVENSFNNIGIHLTKSELMQATETSSDSVAGETVDVKELISAMKETRRLKNYTAVLDCILALKLIKEHQVERLKHEMGTLRTIDLPTANQVIGQALRSANIPEAGQAKFNNFLRILTKNPQLKTSAALEDGFNILAKMKNERIGFTELQMLMQSFNIILPTEDMSEALAFCNVDDNNTLNLKEFIRNVIYTDTFVTRPELQLICLALSKFKDDHFDLQTLQTSLDTMELFRASELLKEVMKVAKVDSYGKVNLEELIRVLTVIPEIPEATVLMDTLDAMHNIIDHEVNVNDLAKTLTTMGIKLTPDEMQSLCNSVTVTEDGSVDFNDIMKEIIGTESFEEFHALQNAFRNIHKIVKEDIKKEDLLDALENLGSHLTPDDLQEVLAFASIDESGKVHGMEFLKVLSSISDIRALQNATKVVGNLKEEKMTIKQLEDTLENMGVDLPSSTFNQIIQTVRTDENDEVDFKEFLLALGETEDFTEMEALQRVITIVGKMHGDQLYTNELQDTIDKLGLHLTEEKIQEILYVIDVDADGTVNLKDFLMTLPKMHYFRDSLAFQSAVVAFSKIKDGTVDPGELESILDFLGVKLDIAEFQNALKGTSIPGTGKFGFKDFLVNVTANERFSENSLHGTYSILCRMHKDKVEISQIKDVLAAIGITLTKEQMMEALKNMTVDSDGMVNLKEFMKKLSLTQQYSSAADMEKAVKTLKDIRQDKIEYEELDSIMQALGLQLSQDEIQKALNYVTTNADGTLSMKDFMFALTNNRRFSEADRNRVPIKNLNSILKTMGISLTEEEMKKAFEQVTVDDGMVNLNEFTRNLRVLQELSRPKADTEEKVAVEDIESLLSNMGMQLTKEQLQEALKNVTVDENEKVKMNELIESVVKTQRQSQAEMDLIHVNNLDNALINMGIYLTDDEIKEVLNSTTPDEDGKVNLNDLMEGVKNMKLILSAGGQVVETDELSSSLTRMGLNITEEETQEALKPLTLDGNDKVDMKNVLQNIMLMKRPFKLERDRIDIQDLNRILTSAGVQLTEAEFQEALATTPIDIEGKVNLGEFIKSVRAVQPYPQPEEETIAFLEEKVVIQEEEEEIPVEEEKVAAAEEEEIPVDEEKVAAAEEEEIPIEEEKVAAAEEGEIPVEEEKVAAAEEEEIPVEEEKVAAAEEEEIPVEEEKVAAAEEEEIPFEEEKVAAVEEEEIPIEEEKIPAEEEKVAAAEEEEVPVEEEKIPVEEEKVAAAEEEKEKIPVSEEKVAASEEEEEKISNEKDTTAAQEEEEKICIKEEKNASQEEEEKEKEKIAAQEEKVAVEELGAILANKGISLRDEELEEALIKAKVNVDGTVNLCNFFKAIHEIQGPPPDATKKDEGLEEPKGEKTVPIISQITENKVDIDSLDEVLEEMGIYLTNRQLYEAFKHISIDDDGMVDKKAFMTSVNAILSNQQKDERVDVNTLDYILADMGLYLTEEEIKEALKRITLNDDMTVNLKDFIWAVDDILSSQEQEDISSSDDTLGSSDIFLTPEEEQEDETVSSTDFTNISGDSHTFSNSSSLETYPNKMPDAKMFKLPRMVEKSFLQTPNRVFPSVTFNEEAKSKAVKNLSKPQLEAFRTAYDAFRKDLDGIIDQAALGTTAHSLGINLTEEEVLDELECADMDGDGKVNFTDFLNIITDTKRFMQAVAPKKDDKETVDARGILFFELLSKLVESSKLPRHTTTTIVSYYRQKFLDCTGKRMQPDSKTAKPSDKEKLPRTQSSPITAFAGAARICIMNEKELESYVANLQKKVNPSESPYNQVPIFPLIPNRDVLVKGKPMKDVQKLDVQRKMVPLSSFEDHFLHKKRWIKQIPKAAKVSKPALSLSPELSQKRLTMNDVSEIRQEVKKVTGSYRKAMALRERNKMLKLWKRLRGGEIGLETNNPSFYQIFSTYTWSWNVLQDLVSPRELQEYDKKQYQRVLRPATPIDKLIGTSGKSKRSQK
ncbi:EF-hand calcium-binding domain-containing protein 13 isoform X2 [Pantherophis guttatus]|uniref:EF-hand calcium-binding domain-containing protein 13 isoform X2 n=1 Tax=Pantherophis guttatus TaxID=94885 RepID=A0A6P9BKT0_PANGU|nr:EF-hand calcium-binding domain-containing protein 13 isoform X2 [Pantherophis guttatus]